MSDDIVPKEGGRYLIGIMWGPDCEATFRNGVFIPDYAIDDPKRYLPPEYVNIWEEK